MGTAPAEFEAQLSISPVSQQKWDALVSQTLHYEQSQEEKKRRRREKLLYSAANVPELVLERKRAKHLNTAAAAHAHAPQAPVSTRTLRSNHSSYFRCYGDRVYDIASPVFRGPAE